MVPLTFDSDENINLLSNFKNYYYIINCMT